MIKYDQSFLQYFMNLALLQAQKAIEVDQIPVACVIIKLLPQKQSQPNHIQSYQVLSKQHNQTNRKKNASKHCEINCFEQIQEKYKFTMEDYQSCLLFVTIQPCIMCTHAINLFKVKYVFFGQYNTKFGGCGSLGIFYQQFLFQGGVLEKQSFQIIKSFYQQGNQKLEENMRNRKRKKVKLNQSQELQELQEKVKKEEGKQVMSQKKQKNRVNKKMKEEKEQQELP